MQNNHIIFKFKASDRTELITEWCKDINHYGNG